MLASRRAVLGFSASLGAGILSSSANFDLAHAAALFSFRGEASKNSLIVTPEMFASSAGQGLDDRQAIQDAMDFVGSSGGGTVLLTSKKYRIASTSPFVTAGGPHKAALVVRYNNIKIEITRGSQLFADSPAEMVMFDCSGTNKDNHAKAFVTPRDSRNCYESGKETAGFWELIRILPADSGNRSIVLNTVSDSVKILKGDWLFLRSGGTLLEGERNSYETPFGQYVKAEAINGTEVLLDRPIIWSLGPTLYPPAHQSSGCPVPWGAINMSRPNDAMLENFELSGLIEMRGSGKHSIIQGNFLQYSKLGMAGKPLIIKTDGRVMSMGLSRSSVHMIVVEAGEMLDNRSAWVVCNDACNHEVEWDVNAAGRSLYIHLHEGTSGNIVRAVLNSSQQFREFAGLRAYAKDNRINLKLFGVRDSLWPACRIAEGASHNSGMIYAYGAAVSGRASIITDDGIANSIVTNQD